MSASTFESMEKDELIKMVQNLQTRLEKYEAPYKITHNDEGTCSSERFNTLPEVLEYIKDFLKYARGYERFNKGILIFENFKHFSSLTIKASPSKLTEIDNSITADDWHQYEK